MPDRDAGNLFLPYTPVLPEELHERLSEGRNFRLERIISTGQATPEGQWFEQREDEWVALLTGAAGLRFADEPQARWLDPGDWIHIPAGKKHRVDWTAEGEMTVWLALYCDRTAG